jgi:cell division protein FtsL
VSDFYIEKPDRYLRPVLCLAIAATFCAWATLQAMETRQLTHRLTHTLGQLRQEQRILQDERRNLLVEYATVTDYGQVRTEALRLGMIEPQLETDSLIFLAENAP